MIDHSSVERYIRDTSLMCPCIEDIGQAISSCPLQREQVSMQIKYATNAAVMLFIQMKFTKKRDLTPLPPAGNHAIHRSVIRFWK